MPRADDLSSAEVRSVFIDTTRPSIARCYDAVLGGKDNYEVDRQVRDQLLAVAPALGPLGWDNRGFLVRATRFLAGEVGIDQFLDLGSGLPTVENTHQAAQRVNGDADVVYVDNDPIVLAHGRALLADNDHTHFIRADFTDPDALLCDSMVGKYLDLRRPLALYQVGTLHHLTDEQRPRELMARYIDALSSGSYVVLSHFVNPAAEDPELGEFAARLERTFLDSPMGSGRFRTRAEIASCFDGLEMVEPGLVVVGEWWPDGPRVKPVDPARLLMIGGVGRKP